jgi:hypothetical protein
MFYNALAKFRDEQLENYQGQPLEYSASDYHHISRPGGKPRRGRSQNGRNSAKRRSHVSVVKDIRHRIASPQEPRSCASVESYDPFRSPKHHATLREAKYAQVTIHRTLEEHDEMVASPVVKPPPSIVEEEEPDENGDDDEGIENSPFTVLQKRKHKPSSMKSFQSSKVPHSSSRCPGLSTHSTSYRRNVSFRHARNKSQGSTKPKRRKTGQNQLPNPQTDLKRSPSAASLQMIADGLDLPPIPSSPPLPAQPTVVRASGVKVRSLGQARKVRESDIIWKEDTRKVSHELSQICEEAFNGSSVTTIRTTSTEAGYETPATPGSIASQEHFVNVPIKASADILRATPKECGRSYSIQELTETRRKFVEHSKGRNDNITGYLSGVIGHLDRLIEEDQTQHGSHVNRQDSHSSEDHYLAAEETSLPVITEEFASPIRGPGENTPKLKHKPRLPPPGQRGGDARTTIRMVPHSSLRSMEEVKPLMIRKKTPGMVSDFTAKETNDSARNYSASSRQTRSGSGLERIDEGPPSPERNTGSYSKKWSWFKTTRSHVPDSQSSLPTKERQQILPSNGTIVHTPVDLMGPPPKAEEVQAPTRKTSMERFGGTLLKKLMPKKSNKNMAQSETGKISVRDFLEHTLRHTKDKDRPSSKDQNRNSSLMCKGFPDPESSFEADDLSSPPSMKRRSIANHNWFARVFQIKPASRVIALNTSKAKSRKEVYKLLRDWRDYGMEDVYMDKSNSTVHGRVSEANCKFRAPVLSIIGEY